MAFVFLLHDHSARLGQRHQMSTYPAGTEKIIALKAGHHEGYGFRLGGPEPLRGYFLPNYGESIQQDLYIKSKRPVANVSQIQFCPFICR